MTDRLDYMKKDTGEIVTTIRKGNKEISIRADGTRRVRTINDEPTLTQQQFKEDCDVNTIMKKYMKTGQITHVNTKTGVYGDFTEIPSYEEAMATVIRADDAFMELPAEVRLRFNNNPQMLMDFLAKTDEDSINESIKLGLRVKKVKPSEDPNVTATKELANAIKENTETHKKTKRTRED